MPLTHGHPPDIPDSTYSNFKDEENLNYSSKRTDTQGSEGWGKALHSDPDLCFLL
jgi:hypothetical protein